MKAKRRDDTGSFALFWAEPADRTAKPGLSQSGVVEAGIALADREGLDAVTMQRLASALGVTPMALYRHVADKEELLDLMTDAARSDPPAAAGAPWRVEITYWAHASLTAFQQRPWLLESAQRRVSIGPRWVAWLDAGLHAVAGSGLPAHEIVGSVMLVDGHVRAAAQLAVGAAGTERWGAEFARVLGAVHGDPRYAALTRIMDAGGFGPAAATAPNPFDRGLEWLLDGIEAHAPRAKRRPV